MKHIWKLSYWSIQCHNGPYMFHIRPYNDLFINKMVTRWPCKKDSSKVWFNAAV